MMEWSKKFKGSIFSQGGLFYRPLAVAVDIDRKSRDKRVSLPPGKRLGKTVDDLFKKSLQKKNEDGKGSIDGSQTCI